MTANILFFALSVLLFAQCHHHIEAKAVDGSNDSSNSSAERLELLSYAVRYIKPLTTMSILSVPEGKSFAHALLDDLSVLKTPSAELKTHLSTFANYQKKFDTLKTELNGLMNFVKENPTLENSDETKHKFSIIEREVISVNFEFFDILQKYNTSVALKNPSMENLLIRVTLQKNGFDQIEQNFSNETRTYMEKFVKIFDAYAATLSPEERAKDSKIFAWYAEFKSVPTFEKIAKFFNFYSAEDFAAWAKSM